MTRSANSALMIALAIALAATGCASGMQVRPSSLTALGDVGPADGIVGLQRADGQPVNVPRAVDAELVMRDGTEHAFTYPVSAQLSPNGSLRVRDAHHARSVWVDDVVYASVEPHDSSSGAAGTVIAVCGVAAFVAGIVVLGALAASMDSSSSGSGWGDSTTTSGDCTGEGCW